jgi:hypothetical protein
VLASAGGTSLFEHPMLAAQATAAKMRMKETYHVAARIS